MSKMSELSQVLDEMIACGEGMIKAAQILKEILTLKKAKKKEEKAAAKKAANDKTKTYLYRLRPDFFNEVMCFSKLTNESINNIIEVALLQYLGNKENHDTFAIAQEMAKRLNNRK